jgi:hypothetical protein
MAKQTVPDRPCVPAHGPSQVEVTITVRPRPGSRSHPEQLAAAVVARPRSTLALLIAIAALAGIATIALHAGRPVSGGAHSTHARDAQLAAISAAYGHRPPCPNVTVPARDRAYASVHIDHHPGCSR